MNNGLTIGIPVYNEAGLIERAIRSAAPQCQRLIVADNASTDGTADVCRRLLAEFPNMEYARHPRNIGARANWSYILHAADTPYLMYLGSHDHIDPGYVQTVLKVLEADDGLQIAMGQVCFEHGAERKLATSFNTWTGGMDHRASGRVWNFLFDRAHLAWAAYGIFRTSSFEQCFTDDLPPYGIDVIFLSRILALGRLRIVGGSHYYAWMREAPGEKTDYLDRVLGGKHKTKHRLKLRNDFRVAQFETIMGLFPETGILTRLSLRLRAMVRFGVFKKPGADLVFYLLYLPAKIIRKIERGSRLAAH